MGRNKRDDLSREAIQTMSPPVVGELIYCADCSIEYAPPFTWCPWCAEVAAAGRPVTWVDRLYQDWSDPARPLCRIRPNPAAVKARVWRSIGIVAAVFAGISLLVIITTMRSQPDQLLTNLVSLFVTGLMLAVVTLLIVGSHLVMRGVEILPDGSLRLPVMLQRIKTPAGLIAGALLQSDTGVRIQRGFLVLPSDAWVDAVFVPSPRGDKWRIATSSVWYEPNLLRRDFPDLDRQLAQIVDYLRSESHIQSIDTDQGFDEDEPDDGNDGDDYNVDASDQR
jgi:hypothetical protein